MKKYTKTMTEMLLSKFVDGFLAGAIGSLSMLAANNLDIITANYVGALVNSIITGGLVGGLLAVKKYLKVKNVNRK